MPSYKSKTTNKWFCSFYYTDYQGKRKKKKKEGFIAKKQAELYEREFLILHSGQPELTFEQLCNVFLEDYKNRVRATTYKNLSNDIKLYFRDYFNEFKQISDIKSLNIRAFQNWLKLKGLSNSTINRIMTSLSHIFNFAVDYYSLASNPCKTIKTLKNDKKDFNILTPEEFKQLINCIEEKERIFFITLFYTGLRAGEALALTWEDFKGNTLDINKTLVMVDKEEQYNEPKTKKSKRIVVIPQFLVDMLNEYKSTMYKPKPYHNIFLLGYNQYNYMLDAAISKNNFKKIRLHDFRHSHISHLIHLGVNIVAISERVGHDSASITLSVYGHLYNEDKNKIADILKY